MSATHSARKGRVSQWVVAPDTQFILAGIKIVTAKLDKFEFSLFESGQNGDGGPDGQRVRIMIRDLVHPGRSPIVAVLQDLWSLLTRWTLDEGSPWFLLAMCGINNLESTPMRRKLRKQARAEHAKQLRGATSPQRLRYKLGEMRLAKIQRP